jgi:flavin-dependent dehydrogenase
VTATHVINAAGRWSELGTSVVQAGPRWIGVKQHFYEGDSANTTDLYFFPGGYCGVQPIPGGQVNACALVQASVATTLQDALGLSPALEHRARDWRPASDLFTTAPIFFRSPQPVTDGRFNAGDAAAFIDPFLGDGISIALQTGVLAADCVLRGGTERYACEYRKRVAPALRRAALLRRMSHWSLAWLALKWPTAITAAARVTRVKVA